MKCILMNKNTEIMTLEYNEVLGGFDKIYEIINITYAPLIISNYYNNIDEIINVVKDLNRIDINKLDGIVEWFDELLHKYQNITNISDARINNLCILLNRQINKLKALIN